MRRSLFLVASLLTLVAALGLGDQRTRLRFVPDRSDGYPDASNTGWEHTGVTLTAYSSPCTISTPGTVIDSKDISCCPLLIRANDVTVKRSKFSCSGNGTEAICNDCDGGGVFTGLLVEDVEIDLNDSPASTGITSRNFVARRVHIYGGENHIWCENTCIIEDSYLHDNVPHDTDGCPLEPGPNCHTDGIQVPDGSDDILIQHNRIYGGWIDASHYGNSAITIAASPGSVATNVDVIDNILAGGGHTLYCAGNASSTNSITNNKFSTIFESTVGGDSPRYVDSCSDEPNWTGNVCYPSLTSLLAGSGGC